MCPAQKVNRPGIPVGRKAPCGRHVGGHRRRGVFRVAVNTGIGGYHSKGHDGFPLNGVHLYVSDVCTALKEHGLPPLDSLGLPYPPTPNLAIGLVGLTKTRTLRSIYLLKGLVYGATTGLTYSHSIMLGKRHITGLHLTNDGGINESNLDLEINRCLLSNKHKEAWLLESEPFFVTAARRGKYKEIVIVNDEHPVPIRPPWIDPTASTPEHNALFRERNRRLAGLILKKRSKSDNLLTLNMAITGGAFIMFAITVFAYVDLGGIKDKLPF